MHQEHFAGSRRIASGAAGAFRSSDERLWDAVGADWVATGRQRVWRTHSDAVAGALLARWMPRTCGAVLKTDLFDEALSAGLYPALQDRAAEVHGIDVAGAVVHAAGQRHAGMRVRVADVRRLPYPEGRFDAVVSPSTLDHFDHVSEITAALREIRRVTAPGGCLILTLDNPGNPKIALRARLHAGLMRRAGLVPYKCGVTLGEEALVRAVERAGFRVRETTTILHCPRVTAVWLAALVERLDAPRLEAALHAGLRPFERLERLPTRRLTGHFVAVLAEARH